ncbi:MAG: carbohydrate-binding domain-containing protein [Clostridiales bacterium]|nr:carbohydrate-binding domain-containing protein [Clostridiales bacterium]
MKRFNINPRLLAALTAGTLMLLPLSSCTTPAVTSNVTEETVSAAETVPSMTSGETFSGQDLEIGYDENESETITLNGSSAVSSSSSVIISGSVITITSKGTYIISGTLDDGSIIVDAGDSDDIRLILKGASVSSSDYAAIYCLNADNVYITLDEGTENLLANSGDFESKDDNKVDAAVFAKTDLTINGSGSLEIISTAHGIAGKDDVNITGGSITIESGKDGIQANDSVAIQNASVDITCGKDGIQADNEDDLSKGYVYISSGNISITAGDDGITATSFLQIDDGTVSIKGSYEGLEGQNITINGGDISIVSSDDAVNAVSASSSGEMMNSDGVSSITVTGGNIYILSEGDGIDSNGSFEMTGGTLTVMGPAMGANGSLDVNGSASITGGTVIMAGASSMATNFTNASQGAVLINTGNQAEGTEISISDESGNVILTVESECSYQTVLISSPELLMGNTYTVTAGDYSETVTLTDYIYGSGSGMGFPGGRGDRMPQNNDPWGFPGDFSDKGF